MNLIGNNIKIIRKQIGLTQEELALHIGVTPQAVSRWENGTGMPDISMVVPLAKTLNVSTDYLFGLEKNEIDDNVYVELKRHIEKIETEDANIYGVGFNDFYCTSCKIEDIKIDNKEKNNILIMHQLPL